jgi:uncharacterized protein (UPF0335 family)
MSRMLREGGELPMSTAAAEQEQDQPATRFAKDHLKAFVERIERLEEEKKALADDIRDVYGEAKATGFDVKALRTIIKMRKEDTDERKEHEAILETYMHALGMLN